MGTFTVKTLINAPISAVWDRLAGNIGTIAEWNPGAKESHVLAGAVKTGLGACRHCDLGGNRLEEEVLNYVKEKAVTFQITETDLPFARADIHFTLESAASGKATKVFCSPDYKLKYGCIGEILDQCMVKSKYKKGMNNLLAGLKKDVEAWQ